MKRPTLRDVAQRAGIHPATASRALNPETRHLVSDETVVKVLRVARSLGYQPNPVARSLKTSRSSTIGLVIPDLTNPLFPPIVRGVEDVLGPAGYNAWIVNTDNDATREESAIESLRSRHVDGLVVATARRAHPLLDEISAEGTPVILVNRRCDRGDLPSVTPDDAAGSALIVHHLAALGHRRIAHLAGPLALSTSTNRLRAYRQALADHDLPADPALVVECRTWSIAAGAEAMRTLLDSGVEFTAVQAGNDLLALGCYDAIAERGLRCPEDLSIVGFNDIPLMDKLQPPLTTVHIPHYEIGMEAARMLLDELRNPGRPARAVLMPVTLRERGSTRPVDVTTAATPA